jgi:hypothetical protein
VTKILNLDKLVTPATKLRELVIGGATYPVVPMSVAAFIDTTRTVEKLKLGSTIAEQLEATIDMICHCVPTLPREVLTGFDLEKLDMIAVFARGDDVDAQVETEEGSEGKPAARR